MIAPRGRSPRPSGAAAGSRSTGRSVEPPDSRPFLRDAPARSRTSDGAHLVLTLEERLVDRVVAGDVLALSLRQRFRPLDHYRDVAPLDPG